MFRCLFSLKIQIFRAVLLTEQDNEGGIKLAVIDLSNRTTEDWSEYNNNKTEYNSKIYVRGKLLFDNDGAQCINFTVGDHFYQNGQLKQIPNKGLRLSPRELRVVETEQFITIPLNMYGLVFGYGINIFRGCILSPGKIDPGFKGKLKLGFYNGSDSKIVLHKGDVIASGSFWNIQTTMDYPLPDYHAEPIPLLEDYSLLQKAGIWLSKNWYSLLALIIAFATLIATMGE